MLKLDVDAHKVRTGYLAKDDFRKLIDSLGRTTQAPMFIDDSSTLTVMEMRAKCRRLKAEHGLSLIIVDYLQLMSGYGRTENRNQEISGISRGLKALAKELNVPVIALSQLSRAPEQRQGDHKPQLSDLRESGSIEQDADLVMFIYREEVYKPSRRERRPCGIDHCQAAQWAHRNRETRILTRIHAVRDVARHQLIPRSQMKSENPIRLPAVRPHVSEVDRPLSYVPGVEYFRRRENRSGFGGYAAFLGFLPRFVR